VPPQIARLSQVLWIPLAALALSWALSFTPLFQRLDALSLDAQTRLAAREHFFRDALVIDIDDASLRTLQPFFGSWPYTRDTYAVLLDYFGEQGAHAVVFDILFADAREGDARLQQSIQRNPNVVLAATSRSDAADAERLAAALDGLAWKAPAGLPAVAWPSALLPLPEFTAPAAMRTSVGVVSVVSDRDGMLRRLPLFHRIDGRHLPALPLAAHFAGRPHPPVRVDGDGVTRVGPHAWPTDDKGAVHLHYPRNPNSVLSMPFARVAHAMLGQPGAELDPSVFRGKTIFIGSSAFLSDRVLTPVGDMNGLYVLAVAHQALAHNLVLKPRHGLWTGFLLLIALLPSLLQVGRTRRSALAGVAISALAGLAIYAAHLGLLAGLRQESSLLLPLTVVLTASLLETGRALRRVNEEQKARIHVLAHDDPLTHLPNRFSLHAHLAHAIEGAQQSGGRLAVLLIDLDNFKTVNDTLGHEAGDRMLMEATARLKSSVRSDDIVARLGGDEFGVVISGRDDIAVAQCAEVILNAMATPYQLAGQELHITSSVGISVYPSDGADVAALLKNADTALHLAKVRGRNSYCFFTPDLSRAAMDRLLLENQLRHALARGELELNYQPQIDIRSGRMTGAEALVRWNHPTHGLLAPDHFIPMAEDSGLILPLGEWVLRTACQQLQDWRAAGLTHIERVAVNLSARQFEQPDLPQRVASILQETGLHPSRLELEITESVATKNPERSIEILNTLRNMGVALALDDFGTGHSSLAYLKLFPINCLKIDRSFVRDIETDRHNAEICSATVALANKLGLKVLAEGVETLGQFNFLRNIDCAEAQGFLTSGPLPADAMARFQPSVLSR
jgi:diguanylate cyclase (GGDEF)-like protein